MKFTKQAASDLEKQAELQYEYTGELQIGIWEETQISQTTAKPGLLKTGIQEKRLKFVLYLAS